MRRKIIIERTVKRYDSTLLFTGFAGFAMSIVFAFMENEFFLFLSGTMFVCGVILIACAIINPGKETEQEEVFIAEVK